MYSISVLTPCFNQNNTLCRCRLHNFVFTRSLQISNNRPIKFRLAKTTEHAKLEHREDSQQDKRESFLEGLTQSTIDFKLETKMRRLLAKYRERKSKEQVRKMEVGSCKFIWRNVLY